MITLQGKSVFGGIAIGKISIYKRQQNIIKRYHVDNIDAEIERFEAAKQKALEELKDLFDKAVLEVGEANAMIFDIHQMMLNDLDYCESITNMISTENVNAEYAVGKTSDNFSQMFASMDDAYMKARAVDVKDISERVLGLLTNNAEQKIVSDGPVIIVADDLAPSETVQLDKSKVLGFVTEHGSSNSHTAILARTMNIPAVIGVKDVALQKYDGVEAIIDGFTGTIYMNPDKVILSIMKQKQKDDLAKRALLDELKGQKNITLDGQTIDIYANIGNFSDVGAVLKNDAGGIGLFRSEFLYLESEDYPTEEEQFSVYKMVAQNMAGKKVVIRTLDIGADKKIDYFNLPHEENPALGYRAIRICLEETDVFKTQLRALYRASAFGNIAIMFPMIISVSEIKRIKEILEEVKTELRSNMIPFREDLEIGIMIETPAAVMISDLLAKEVDFFSVGTNDLTQYTLAIDRQNQKLERFYDPHHLGLLRMIKIAADNAHKNKAWIGICGELGADMELTETFLAMGIDEISVSPSFVLPLRKKVRAIDVSKIKEEVLSTL
jgi:phosphoenolpyruvate-protein phosphotransferase